MSIAENYNSTIQIQNEYPSISQMSDDQISSFKKVGKWVQNRTLFKEPTSWSGCKTEEKASIGFFGGACYTDEFLSWDEGTLRKMIRALTSDDIYLDIGAGDGHAIHQCREMYPEGAKVIGIASTQPSNIERIMDEEKRDEKFSFFLCDFKEFPIGSLAGKVSVITDIKGAFRYGQDPAGVIQKMGALLKEGGFAIIDFGYGLGINPPSCIKKEVICQTSRDKITGSTILLHLWFHTLKGFDVLQMNKNVDESLQIHNEVMENPYVYQQDNFGDRLMVLRRNSQPVDAEVLIPNPEWVNEWANLSDSEKNYDSFYPRYTWNPSQATQLFLSKIEDLNK